MGTGTANGHGASPHFRSVAVGSRPERPCRPGRARGPEASPAASPAREVRKRRAGGRWRRGKATVPYKFSWGVAPGWYGFVPLALSSSPHGDLANVAFHVSHFDRSSFTLPGPSGKLDLAQGSCRGAGGGGLLHRGLCGGECFEVLGLGDGVVFPCVGQVGGE